MKRVIEKLVSNAGESIKIDGSYYLNAFSDGYQGNIRRSDNTVLTRYCIKDDLIKFAFQQESDPRFFFSFFYDVSREENLEEVKKISNPHAEELYTVLKRFIESDERKNDCKQGGKNYVCNRTR
ncbi:MAG: hypothetical protein K6A74_03880 [Lachnospiraceae bacterium]|nr:hypothetical protein [Lachnospiraceae bacterium]